MTDSAGPLVNLGVPLHSYSPLSMTCIRFTVATKKEIIPPASRLMQHRGPSHGGDGTSLVHTCRCPGHTMWVPVSAWTHVRSAFIRIWKPYDCGRLFSSC